MMHEEKALGMYWIYINYRLAQGLHRKGLVELPIFVDRMLEVLFNNTCSVHKIET